MKRTLILLALLIHLNSGFAQKEINLGLDKEAIGVMPYLFNITPAENKKITVRYLCFPPCLVKSDDEATMNGAVLSTGKNGFIKGGVILSDAAMILITQEVDPASNTFSITQKDIIAIRNVAPSTAYVISLEGVDNKCKHIYERKEVPYNKTNLSTIKNLTANELNAIEKILKSFEGRTSARNFDFTNFQISDVKEPGISQMWSNLDYKLPDDEKILKNNPLDIGVDYLITRDKKIKKELGEAYKTYFIYPGKILVKCDSAFYADRSDNEFPDRVFNINKNKYTGVLTRLSCEPLNSDIKLNYFRYSYIDTDKSVKRFRFQTENGKLNSFIAERTFKLGDTLIHVTRHKSKYQSSVFVNDTVKLRYPLTTNDTLKYGSVFCNNLPAGPADFFGFDDRIFLNEKLNDLILIGEQSTLTKSGVHLVDMNHPEAGVKGFALTKLYVIKNNSVRSITRISVPNFSNSISTYSVIRKDDNEGIYLLNMSTPVFLIVDKNGNLKLKDAGKPGHLRDTCLLTNQSTFVLNGVTYGLFKETSSGKLKLIPFSI